MKLNLISLPLVSYALKAASRDRIVLSFLIILFVIAGISIIIGNTAMVESNQFIIVFVGSSLRVVGVLALSVFVTFFVRRSFESNEVDFLLSRSISRSSFIFSYSVAFSYMAVLTAIAISGITLGLCFGLLGYGHFMWMASLIVEYIIVANIAMFFSMTLSSATAASLFTIAAYVLGRISGQILGIISPETGDGKITVLDESIANIVSSKIFETISLFIPRLDLMAYSGWLVYGNEDAHLFYFSILQGVLFIAVLIFASIIDLKRRQF